ncbi:MAG: plasmid pRiA4b ORF-3 family protein [Dysgonamonadaceae bacterium]|jgi:hypothetical protein|nr:plasmid pRiA4b ORF-3 family protein [Dysgonamonadaceae bacterium]
MVYKFLLLSDEVDDFKREIAIDSEDTFFDLHNAILDSVSYEKDQMASFFICSDDWAKLTEITLIEMDTNSDEDSYVMDKTRLNEGLEEEGQKLMYVFDYLTERAFFMELREVIPGKNLDKPVCTKSVGLPPEQIMAIDDVDPALLSSVTGGMDENFYGDEDFDMDELDQDGFDGLGGGNPYDDDNF